MCLLREEEEEEMCFIQSKSCWCSGCLCILCVFFPLHLLHEGRAMKFCILNLLIHCKSILNCVQFRWPFQDLGKMSRINVICVMGQQSLILQGRDWKSLLFKAVRGLWTVGSVQRSAFRVGEQTNWNMSLGKALWNIFSYQELDLTGIASVNNCCASKKSQQNTIKRSKPPRCDQHNDYF